MAGLEALRSVALAGHVRPASGYAASGTGDVDASRVLPVLPELSRILPGRGLRRGSTIAVAAPAAGQPASDRSAADHPASDQP
ncbi:MAG TPA: hypothetical protein VNV66_06825, partial [Pilimelia sp.]|nr:hypothetical protein [Pilimelia sp.]